MYLFNFFFLNLLNSDEITLHCQILDARDLSIKAVRDEETGQVLQYTLGDSHPNFGSEFKINLPSDTKKKYDLGHNYFVISCLQAVEYLEYEYVKVIRKKCIGIM